MRRLKRCLDCGALSRGSRCEKHRKAKRARDSAARLKREPWRVLYNTRRWRQTRAAVLARDGHRCRFVDEGTGARCEHVDETGKTLEAHHLDPVGLAYQRGGMENAARIVYFAPRIITACADGSPANHHRLETTRARAFSRGNRVEV